MLTSDNIRYLEDIESPITKLVSINDFHAKHGPMETKFLDTLAQHLLTNHNIYVYHRAAIAAIDVLKEATEENRLEKNTFFLNKKFIRNQQTTFLKNHLKTTFVSDHHMPHKARTNRKTHNAYWADTCRTAWAEH